MPLEVITGALLLVALSVYIVTGGADFGGGFWELVAHRRHREEEHRLITKAIAPIWEANHVWLIVAIVLLSGAFPRVLPVLSTALHVPLLIMLVGISLRGAAFVFRHYGPEDERYQRKWGWIFSTSSFGTPLFLGITLGAAVRGTIRVKPDGTVITDFISDWWSPFPIAVGVYTLAICVFLSAVYLAAEAKESEVAKRFRARGIVSSIGLGAVAWGVLILSQKEAPLVYQRLTLHIWSWPLHLVTAIFSIGALAALILNRLKVARVLAVLQALAIMMGLGMAQYPYLVTPDLTLQNSAAPAGSLQTLLVVTAIGLGLIVPAFGYLYWVFKFQKSSLN